VSQPSGNTGGQHDSVMSRCKQTRSCREWS